MKLYGRFLRWYSPKKYIKRGIARDQRKHAKILKETKHASAQERYDHECSLHQDLDEWYDWLTVIEDAEPPDAEPYPTPPAFSQAEPLNT